MTVVAGPVKRSDGLLFISYHESDYEWAHWVASQLEREGYTVFFAGWHVAPGNDFTREMHRALQEARRVVAILSPRYMADSSFGWMEIAALLARDPDGTRRNVVPVRVEEFQPDGILQSRVYLDLFDKDERAERDALLAGVAESPARPSGGWPGPGSRGNTRRSTSPLYPLHATESDYINAAEYEGFSRTQARQRGHLLRLVEAFPEDLVIDVGCGPGGLALEVAPRVQHVLGIDKKADMVHLARKNAEQHHSPAEFRTANLLHYRRPSAFTLVLTNHTMHWIEQKEVAYRRLYELLRRDGRLGVHQGGSGTYSGLIEVAVQVVADLGLSEYFEEGWNYPHYYPSVTEFCLLLRSAGFVDVEIFSNSSDGEESPTLVKDFAVAGLAPFIKKVPGPMREPLREAFREAASRPGVNRYTHNLYALAKKS